MLVYTNICPESSDPAIRSRRNARLAWGFSVAVLSSAGTQRALAQDSASVRLLLEEVITGEGASSFQPLSTTHYPSGGPGGSGYGLVDHDSEKRGTWQPIS